MKNFFSIIIIFGVLLVGGGWVFMQQQEQEAKKKLADDLVSARRTFATKARAAANEEDNDQYLSSMKASLEAYKKELKDSVYKDRPEWRDSEAYKNEVEAQFKEGKMNELQRKSKLEGYEITKKAYDVLMSGGWRPILAQKGQDDTRLDLYKLERLRDDEGRPLLQFSFFFWGIEDATHVSWGPMEMRIWHTEMEKVKEGRRRVEKEVEKVLGRSEGESQPHVILQSPKSYIEDFPAFVSIGYLWFPPLPQEAKFVDLTYSYTTRQSGGGEVHSVLKWEKLPVTSDWMLGAGESWEAEEVEATEDEIAGRDPSEEEEEEAQN